MNYYKNKSRDFVFAKSIISLIVMYIFFLFFILLSSYSIPFFIFIILIIVLPLAIIGFYIIRVGTPISYKISKNGFQLNYSKSIFSKYDKKSYYWKDIKRIELDNKDFLSIINNDDKKETMYLLDKEFSKIIIKKFNNYKHP